MDKAEKLRQRLKGAKYVRDELRRMHPYLPTRSRNIGCGDYDCDNAHIDHAEFIAKEMLDDADESVRDLECQIKYAQCEGHEFSTYKYCIHCDMPEQ